jgi:hypothetical protein
VRLRRLYLIYGINGSGKSTFASLLREAAGDTSWSSGLEIDVNDARQLRRVNQASDQVWPALRVFNRDYVNEKAHLSRWNEARVIHVEELTPGRVEESSSRAVRRATNWQQCQGSPLLVGPPPARRCSDESTRARGRPAQSVPCALVGQQGFQGSPAAQVDRDAFQGRQCRRPTLPLDGLSGRRVQPAGAVR